MAAGRRCRGRISISCWRREGIPSHPPQTPSRKIRSDPWPPGPPLHHGVRLPGAPGGGAGCSRTASPSSFLYPAELISSGRSAVLPEISVLRYEVRQSRQAFRWRGRNGLPPHRAGRSPRGGGAPGPESGRSRSPCIDVDLEELSLPRGAVPRFLCRAAHRARRLLR